MSLLPSKEILKHLSDIIHADTQQHEFNIDLTVSEVHLITGSGSLDFGGSEFHAAESVPVKPEKENPDDDYGWWKLKKGTHRLLFNESLEEIPNGIALISPHSHAQQAGLITNSRIITASEDTDQLFMNIVVPEAGCRIKENARIASLIILEG
ncbi:hypothetical protein [Gracilimonas mengyeensis]|uniref:dCTP deaminase n=1 Tax=Gracilimonas mengyeensis TaxID=1302730 RepID=A0A521F5Y9_9BACT|nr:hypothetical protein [Gracilimonas mengyeensis]SMO91605.1 hypothetical protein SAMN06265219_11596 [Gracilimonas mengyeensis]